MAVISENVRDMKGYKLHLINTGKYKTNTLVWKMKAPINAENVTLRALLPYVLQSNSKKYPSTALLRSYLDDLYGAVFYVDLAKKGEYHVISMIIEVANEKFLTDSTPLLKKAVEFLAEILTNPNTDGNAFNRETVEQEKRTLKQRIQSVFDDKMKYSNFRLIEEMCKDEPYALNVHGRIEDVDSITPEALYEYYQQAINEDELDLYIIGDIDEEETASIVDEEFHFQSRTPKKTGTGRAKIGEVQEIQEVQDIRQGKLNIGFRTNILYGEPDYFPLQVLNGIYGGFSHSKLFINVREKNSLAYYAASRLESHKGLMIVMSGIDSKNYQQAVDIIKEQMEAMKKGDFSDEELAQTKAVIKNQLLETMDTARGTNEILYHNVVAGKNISVDEWLTRVDETTKEDIEKAAAKIQLDTIYFLTGAEAGKQ